MASHFREVRVPRIGSKGSLQHHISILLLARIQFALYHVQSPLLMASRLISFPAGTKTLQFPAFFVLLRLERMSHSGTFGSMSACDSPKHIVACHALHHHSKPSHPPNSVRNPEFSFWSQRHIVSVSQNRVIDFVIYYRCL